MKRSPRKTPPAAIAPRRPQISAAARKLAVAIVEGDWEKNNDVFALREASGGHELLVLGQALFEHCDLLRAARIEPPTLEAFLLRLEVDYGDNPYHNTSHASDVLLTTYRFLSRFGFVPRLSKLQLFAALLAAIIHDYRHPGTTNAHEARVRSRLSLLFSDDGVLERHHLACAFEVLSQPEHALLGNLAADEYEAVRALIIELVLHTDLSRHFTFITRLKSLAEALQEDSARSPALRRPPTVAPSDVQLRVNGTVTFSNAPSSAPSIGGGGSSGSAGIKDGDLGDASGVADAATQTAPMECDGDSSSVRSGDDLLAKVAEAAAGGDGTCVLAVADNGDGDDDDGAADAIAAADGASSNSGDGDGSRGDVPSPLNDGLPCDEYGSFSELPFEERPNARGVSLLASDAKVLLITAVKFADIGHSLKPFDLHTHWTARVSEEFWALGDKERGMGLTPGRLCNRETDCDVPKAQVGFFRFVCLPFFRAVGELVGQHLPPFVQLRANFDHWQQQVAAGVIDAWSKAAGTRVGAQRLSEGSATEAMQEPCTRDFARSLSSGAASSSGASGSDVSPMVKALSLTVRRSHHQPPTPPALQHPSITLPTRSTRACLAIGRRAAVSAGASLRSS